LACEVFCNSQRVGEKPGAVYQMRRLANTLMAFASRDKEQGKLISSDTLLSRLAQRCHRYQEEEDDDV
jgi:hypothetical protein